MRIRESRTNTVPTAKATPEEGQVLGLSEPFLFKPRKFCLSSTKVRKDMGGQGPCLRTTLGSRATSVLGGASVLLYFNPGRGVCGSCVKQAGTMKKFSVTYALSSAPPKPGKFQQNGQKPQRQAGNLQVSIRDHKTWSLSLLPP